MFSDLTFFLNTMYFRRRLKAATSEIITEGSSTLLDCKPFYFSAIQQITLMHLCYLWDCDWL